MRLEKAGREREGWPGPRRSMAFAAPRQRGAPPGPEAPGGGAALPEAPGRGGGERRAGGGGGGGLEVAGAGMAGLEVAGAGVRFGRLAGRPAERNAPGTPSSLCVARAARRGTAQVELSERRRMRPASAPAPLAAGACRRGKGFVNDFRGFKERARPGSLHVGRWESRGGFGTAEDDAPPWLSRSGREARGGEGGPGDKAGAGRAGSGGQENEEEEERHPSVAPDLHAGRYERRAGQRRSEEFKYNKFMATGRHAGRWEGRAAFGEDPDIPDGDWEPLQERPPTPTEAARAATVLLHAGSGFHNRQTSLARAYEGACTVDEGRSDCFGVACGRGLGTRRAALEFLVDRRRQAGAQLQLAAGQGIGDLSGRPS